MDPAGELAETALAERAALLAERADSAGIGLVDPRIDPRRRELRLLMTGDDSAAMRDNATQLCAEVFGTEPANGVLTYLSRGTDDDARGVLAGLGLTGDIARTPGDDGVDIVTVRLSAADLERVPESRVHTALEASLNCEVRIVTS